MKLSLTTKIFLAFALLLASFLSLAMYSVQELRTIGEDLRAINEGHLALARLIGQLETHHQNRFRDLRRSISETDPKGQEVILRIGGAYFPDVIRARMQETRDLCQQQISRLSRRPDEDARAKVEFFSAVLARVDRLAEIHEDVNEVNELLLQRVRTSTAMADVAPELDRLELKVRGELYQLNDQVRDETDQTVRRAERDERSAIWHVLAITGITLLLGIALTLMSSRALAPISRLVTFARAISRGDYEQKIDAEGGDELSALGDELKAMARSQKEREEELDRKRDELERAYHRVDELKRYHENIVRSLNTAVVVTDRNLRITSTNRAAERHFGLSGAELRDGSLEALPLGQSVREHVGALGELITQNETTQVASMAYGELLVDLSIFPLLSEKGEVLGLVLAMEDVTEAVRTKEALIRSERLAAIGRMSAHVTHEVRNPLSSIGLNAEALEGLVDAVGPQLGEEAEEARRICRAIGREVDRLNAITEAYLKFARLPRPKLRPEDLTGLLRTLAAFVKRDCEAAQVELVLELDESAPPMEVDADQIRQAVLNLVRNAKESMPEGGRLVLGLERLDDGVCIKVADQGVGIEEADLPRIFDPFFSRKLTGTGLGLALTQQIVLEHGAELQVHSEPGRGSEFRIVMKSTHPTKITRISEVLDDPELAMG